MEMGTRTSSSSPPKLRRDLIFDFLTLFFSFVASVLGDSSPPASAPVSGSLSDGAALARCADLAFVRLKITGAVEDISRIGRPRDWGMTSPDFLIFPRPISSIKRPLPNSQMTDTSRPRPRPRPRPKLKAPEPKPVVDHSPPRPSTSSVVAPSSPAAVEIQDEDEMFMRNRQRTVKTWTKWDALNSGMDTKFTQLYHL